MEQYKEQNLQQLSIYELRTIARQIGVKSPTTKKHSELVESILKIQNGEERAFSTKKGRPPKVINFVNQPLDANKEEGLMYDYAQVEETSDSIMLCADSYVDGIHDTYLCHGMVREFNGKKYLCDYLSSRRIAYIEDKPLNKNIKKDDFVIGQAFEISPKTGVLSKVNSINFENEPPYHGEKTQKFFLKPLVSLEEIYKQVIEQDNNPIKIVLELEADNFGIVTMHDKCVYMYSGEHDDIKRSYNAVLDCLKLVKILSENNKQFSLYFIDIDYAYITINAYLMNNTARADIDACQLLKEILVAVKNAPGGEMHIFEKSNYKRNPYLEAI